MSKRPMVLIRSCGPKGARRLAGGLDTALSQ